MYTRRATLVSSNSLELLLKVWRTRSTKSLNSVEVLNFFRNLGTATQRADFYNTFDHSIAETSDYNSDSRNNRFCGRNLGGVEQNQNHNGVYGQYGNFSAERKDFYNGVSNQNNWFHDRTLGGVEQNRNSNGVSVQNLDGQYGNFASGYVGNVLHSEVQKNANFNGCGNRDLLGTSPQFQHNWSGHCDSGGNYAGNPEMSQQTFDSAAMYHQQSGVGIYYSNAVSYQQNVDARLRSDMKLNEEMVEVSEAIQSRTKTDDLDELCKEGKLKEAVELLGLLEQEGLQIDLPRYMVLMKACGENKALEEAKSVHEHLLKSIPHLEVGTYNQILEMYSKCGSMVDAFAVFDQMPKRNLTSMDIIISWLAKNGVGEDSLELFAEFKRSGLKPDGQMFIGVFSACSVLGDIVEGILHFESMSKDYGVVPSMEHYVSVVDMLGIEGCLDEALEFIEKMPIEPGVELWETLMCFCRINGNVVLGDHCAELVQLLDPTCLNEHSMAGLIPIDACEIAKEKEKKKLSCQNLLYVRSRVHDYRAGDRSHPDHERIYALLRGLKQQMKEVGYAPETKFVLHDVDQEAKEEALMTHSERLAAAQGFLTSPARSPMRTIKNLRVCGDCHNAFKIISKIVGREIIARDSKRFHHFRDGSCSCNDYW